MVIGFVGSGSMAAAMARGWADLPDSMLFSDGGSGRAEELAREVGGEAIASNAELAERADLVVLAVKPPTLEKVAGELEQAKAVLSLLGATSLERIAQMFPTENVFRVMPNVGVEMRRGVLCFVAPTGADPNFTVAVRGLLAHLGRLVDLPDSMFDAATAVMGCAPAYLALAAETIGEAGAQAGLDPDLAGELIAETIAGTGELLSKRDPADVRRAVTSPGGSTEAGLEALERDNVREAFHAAVNASLERMRG